MLKKSLWILFILIVIVSAHGCDTAFKVGDSTLGIQSGKFFFTDGVLRTNYHAEFQRVWDACVETMRDMKAIDLAEDKKISEGRIEAKVYDEEVRIAVEYKGKNMTQVAIRVGVSGSNISSQLIHDKIKQNLLKK
ncbi:MAG: DUF3568 family protein [Deltaproteobacteria bacterium]|nr:DUF3568 family protein [Deltaproteobacteria bacterium]